MVTGYSFLGCKIESANHNKLTTTRNSITKTKNLQLKTLS
jgi:hypothetical protein